jgi:hypothetical protein
MKSGLGRWQRIPFTPSGSPTDVRFMADLPECCPSGPGPVAVVGKLLNERQLSMNEFEAGNGGYVGETCRKKRTATD